MFHRHYWSHSRKWCTDRYLCGYLLIWWPLWVDISFVLHHVLTDLCTWCSRICRWYLDTRFITASGDGCVTKHNLFFAHESYPSCLYWYSCFYFFVLIDTLICYYTRIINKIKEFYTMWLQSVITKPYRTAPLIDIFPSQLYSVSDVPCLQSPATAYR